MWIRPAGETKIVVQHRNKTDFTSSKCPNRSWKKGAGCSQFLPTHKAKPTAGQGRDGWAVCTVHFLGQRRSIKSDRQGARCPLGVCKVGQSLWEGAITFNFTSLPQLPEEPLCLRLVLSFLIKTPNEARVQTFTVQSFQVTKKNKTAQVWATPSTNLNWHERN